MNLARGMTAAAFLCAAAAFGSASAAQADWIDSPEAYFATRAERLEWVTLHTPAEREAFQLRYWARRDPTPDTPPNEFHELVAKRIAAANERFTIKRQHGAETARGLVYIVLGTPARVQDSVAGPVRPGGRGIVGATEGNETTSVWTYDRLRTAKILDALGRPSLEFTFVIEPNRGRDDLQNPGLMNQIRDEIAELTILRDQPRASSLVVAPAASLPETIVQQLDGIEAPALNGAAIWLEDATPAALLWINTAAGEAAKSHRVLYALVRDSERRQVYAISQSAEPHSGFMTITGAKVYPIEIPLPAGVYDCAVMVQDADSGKTVAAGRTRLMVPDKREAASVSSLLLTGNIEPARSQSAPLTLGDVAIRPRADATFSRAESLWYFFQMAGPTDPSGVAVTVMLRPRDGHAAQTSRFKANLQPLSQSAMFVAGHELPLKTLEPGVYSLYVTVADPAGREQVRRADFQVVESTGTH